MSGVVVTKKLDCDCCLKLPSDPTVLPCGHLICLSCARYPQPSKCPSDGIRFVADESQ